MSLGPALCVNKEDTAGPSCSLGLSEGQKESELLILEVSMIGGFPDTATQEKP